MKGRGLVAAGIIILLFIVACAWFGRAHPGKAGGVGLAFVQPGSRSSSTNATFRVYNDKSGAIFLSWVIVETNGPTGWHVAERTEPKDPRVVDAGTSRDLSVSAPTNSARWRVTIVYGTATRGPVLLMTRIELAIRNRSWSGWKSIGVFTGQDHAAAEISR